MCVEFVPECTAPLKIHYKLIGGLYDMHPGMSGAPNVLSQSNKCNVHIY